MVVSARLPLRLVERLDDAALKSNRNRNQLIALALEYALERIEIIDDQNEQSKK